MAKPPVLGGQDPESSLSEGEVLVIPHEVGPRAQLCSMTGARLLIPRWRDRDSPSPPGHQSRWHLIEGPRILVGPAPHRTMIEPRTRQFGLPAQYG